MPKEVSLATKPAIALAQIERLLDQGAPRHSVLADAGYGTGTAFRGRLSELGLADVVGVTGQVNVWPPGHAPLLPVACSARGNVPTRQRMGTSLAAAQRTQRHVPSSITSLRLRIAAALLRTLPRCPCCLRASARLRL